ncbi:MAG TPA: PEGA domain-containing protein [Clostridia bacterium]|nr:PEGA domain-containing protein [Clostridia bacterium]
MIDFAQHRLKIFLAIAIFIASATFLAIKFAQGYRFDFSHRTLRPTGLLVATSNPRGAQVFINGELKTATDNTLSLAPGEYLIEIKKNAFYPWQKKLIIKKELVTQADAFLFPQVPDLKPLTFNEVQNPQLSYDGSKIVYSVPLPHPEAGLWVMDLTDFLFNIGREPRQIAQTRSRTRDFSQATYFWSLDSKQIVVEFAQPPEKLLLDASQLNSALNLKDISSSWPEIVENWFEEDHLRQEAKLKKLAEALQEILKENAKEIEFSPDGTKVLYIATGSAEIPEKLLPPVLVSSTQPETRTLEPNKIYVYDLKEDRNFLLPFELPQPSPTPLPTKKALKVTPTPTPYQLVPPNSQKPCWFPTSQHLYWLAENKVLVCEYDGTNLTTIYSGPMIIPYVFAAPGANKLIILTQLNLDPEAKPNLYAVSLR